MNAVDVHHVVSGRADGPVVVLSNSLGATHTMWDENLPELERHFRVVRYDTRGHGASPVPGGPYSIDDLADDVVALLDRLGVERAHFVGLSLGGMTAMWLAIHRPDRVGRVALLCTSAAEVTGSGVTQLLHPSAIGGFGLFALECWTAVVDYPFDSGGRALLSWPAFIPAPVEFAALTAGVGGIIAMFVQARLTRLSDSVFDWDEVAEGSRSSFVLALGCTVGDDANAAVALLADAGAARSRVIGL